MTTTKRKYGAIARNELDYENPVNNEKKPQVAVSSKKSKGKSKSKSEPTPTLLPRWPDDVSNTLELHPSKHRSKHHGNTAFGRLPDEMILAVLTYLNKASIVAFGRTCHRYRAIAYHPTLWRRVDMSYKRVDSEQLRSLLQRDTITLKMYQTTVRTILIGCMEIDYSDLHCFIDVRLVQVDDCISTVFEPSTLRHLDLTSAIISTDLLHALLSSCRSLRKLSLESIPVNDAIIEKISLNEHLDTLHLAMCTGITLEGGQLLTSKLPLLRCLNIAWTNLTVETVQHLCETLPRCMEQLNISGQRYNLTDAHVQSLVKRALRLRVLDISDSVLITDQSIVALRQHSRLLVHLLASRCYLLTSPAFITLKLLPAFSTLDIFGTLAAFPLQQLRDEFGTRIHLNMCPFSSVARPTTGIQRTRMEPSKVKERYQALKTQGPPRSLTRCNSTDLIPQVVAQNQANICPKAPEVLFDNRSRYFNGSNDDQQRPISARTSSISSNRRLSNASCSEVVTTPRVSSMDNGPLHIRFRSIDLSGLLSSKDSKPKGYSSAAPSRSVDCFKLLSDELILTILKYLPRASLAAMTQGCRRLRSLAYDPSLWSRVDMSRKHIESCYLRDVLLRGTVILKMYQTTVHGNAIYSFNQNTWFAKLQFLDLTLATISTDCLLSLLSACRSLRKLSLETLPLNTAIFEKLALNQHLDTLNLTMCTGIDLACCCILTGQMKHLRYLNLGWTQLSDQSVQHICQNIQPTIEQLTLSGFRQGMTDKCVESLIHRAGRLRVLDLSDSSLLTEKSVKSILTDGLQLEHLAFSRCYAIAPIAYTSLSKLPHLVSLDIFGVVDERVLQKLHSLLGVKIGLNQQRLSYVARPTYGLRRTSIWGLRTRP